MSADDLLADHQQRQRMRDPRFERVHEDGRVLLGVSAVVDDPGDPGVAQVVLSGELCPASAPTLSGMLDALFGDGISHLVVDLTSLTLCTSAGVGVLEHARDRAERRGGSIRVVGAHGVVRRVLELCRFSPLD